MIITHDHPASGHGMPVILSDSGEVLDYAAGIAEIRARLGLTAAELAKRCGVSTRTAEGWAQGRLPSAQALNALELLLRSAGGK